jgi:ABC-type branched-subunit amino acid transport system substrate-binding protein
VAHTEQVRADPEPEAHADAAQAVVDAGARCVAFAGTIVDEPASLLEALRAADPALRFVLPMGLADAELARALAPVAEATTIVGPPPPSTGFAERFAEQFGRQPGPWAQYGHTAMRRVLEAIEAAGENGNDRTAVTESYLALPRPAEDLALWQPGPDGLRLERRLPAT